MLSLSRVFKQINQEIIQFTFRSILFTLQVLHGYQENIHDECDVKEPHQSNAWNQKS